MIDRRTSDEIYNMLSIFDEGLDIGHDGALVTDSILWMSIRMEWSTVPNAVDKSRIPSRVTLPLSAALYMSYMSCSTGPAVSVE